MIYPGPMRKSDPMPRAPRRKIAWLSPFGPLSDIGAHSAAVVRALSRRVADYDCELVLFVQPNGSTYATDAPKVTMGPNFSPEALSLFDVVALNIGNSQANHAHINEIALTRGGVVIVHDIVMHDYIGWKFFESLKLPSRYAELLCRHYGRQAIEVLGRSGVTLKDRPTRYQPWNSEHTLALPLIEPFLEKAKAVVVHSQFASEIVAGITDAPRVQLFLPSDKKRPPIECQPALDRKIRFSITGHINRSKHVDVCIEALLISERLRSGATLRVVGGAADLFYIRELMDLVRENDAQDLVKFEFDVTERRLREVKASTDVFINLRFPNTESASGSLAEQMACGIPTIIFDSGCFREIPEGAALKIADLSTPAPLRAAMETLAADPELRRAIGEAALDFGRDRTADAYATKFLEFVVERDLRAKPAVRAFEADFAPFPWLRRRLDFAPSTERETPTLFHPRERPDFRSIADLDPSALARYLSVGLFRQTIATDALETVREVVEGARRSAIPYLIGRMAFLDRIAESATAPKLSQIAFALEFEALTILRLFDPRKFVIVLFVSVIGRRPEESEIEQAIVTGAASGRLLRVLLESEAFVRRLATAELIETLESLAAALDGARVTGVSQWPLLEPGAALTRDELGEVMGEGWDQPEAEGAWSRATSAKLRFRLTSAERRDGAAVLLDIRVLVPAGLESQDLRLVLNGVEIAHIPIESPDRFIVEIPLDEMQGDAAELALNVSRLVRTSQFGPTGGPRTLGVFLASMKLTRNTARLGSAS